MARGGSAEARARPSPLATLAAVAALVLAAGLLLERWPGKRERARVPRAIGRPGRGRPRRPSPVLFVSGAARVREDEAVLGPGAVELLVRAPVAGVEPAG